MSICNAGQLGGVLSLAHQSESQRENKTPREHTYYVIVYRFVLHIITR